MPTYQSSLIRELLDRYDSPTASVAELLCDRHPSDAVAFTIVEPDLSYRDLTYGELRTESTKFAAVLGRKGVREGDSVAVLMAKSTELVIALLGIWRLGAAHVPLFTAFGTPAINMRVDASGAKVIVADASQIDKLSIGTDSPYSVIAVNAAKDSGCIDFHDAIAAIGPEEPQSLIPATVGNRGDLVRIFTSGTTGTPKCVAVPVRALAAFEIYLELGLDVTSDDVYWNAADPGWAYGLYWGIISPLSRGRSNILLHAPFSPALTWSVLEQFKVTNFTAAPTVYRALRAHESPVPAGLSLRCASSAGEPLTPEIVEWSVEALGVEVRDQFGQTETGMTIVNAWHESLREDVPPGSMGRALPGWSATVLLPDDDAVAPVGTVGRVAISVADSPLWYFEGYVDAPEKSAQRFTADKKWYLTGDAGHIDDHGRFYFSARDDDVIIMAGYRIGPSDIESVLVRHPRVIEAAVIGVPDALRGEVVEAFVVLNDGGDGDDALQDELKVFVKKEFAAHAYPRTIHFVTALPKTPSGKIQRFALRNSRAEQLATTAP